jgi:hypothetical protein
MKKYTPSFHVYFNGMLQMGISFNGASKFKLTKALRILDEME